MQPFINRLRSMLRDEDAAQVVEYALIVAVVAISLLLALQGITNGRLSGFLARVGDCLTGICT